MKFKLTSTYDDEGILDDSEEYIEINNIDELLDLCEKYDEEIIIYKTINYDETYEWELEIYNGYRE